MSATTNPSVEVDPRVYLAAERTLLAWIRTGTAMMGFGFVVDRFGLLLRELETADSVTAAAPHRGLSLWFGTVLILVGVAVNVMAGWQHMNDIARLKGGESLEPKPISMGVLLSAFLGLLGLAMAVYLLMLG